LLTATDEIYFMITGGRPGPDVRGPYGKFGGLVGALKVPSPWPAKRAP
jgi:hypothetical protein